jgi:hypothetical protein
MHSFFLLFHFEIKIFLENRVRVGVSGGGTAPLPLRPHEN